MEPLRTNRFLNIKQVMLKVGLGRSSIYRMMASGDFPLSRELSANAVRWSEAEIDEWFDSRPRMA